MPRAFIAAAAAILVVCSAGTGPAVAAALDSRTFLTWTGEKKVFYIHTTMIAARMIASRNSETRAKCLNDWYFREPKKAHAVMAKAMKEHGGTHPTTIVPGIAAKRCGAFRY